MKVDITIDSDEYTIREIDHTDKWDIGDFGLHIRGVDVTKTDREYAYEVEGSSGDYATVLVEHYSDGCTFGSSEYAEVKGIFKTQGDAIAYAANVDKNHGYFGSHIDFLYFAVVLP